MKKKTKQDQKIDKILSLPTTQTEDEKIKQMLDGLKSKIIWALMDELKNGKGIARIQAAQELERIEREMQVRSDVVVDVEWDVYATKDVQSA